MAVIMFCGYGVNAGDHDDAVSVTAAVQIPNVIAFDYPPEGNEQINASKDEIDDAGAMVHIHVRNNGSAPLAVTDVRWAEQDMAAHKESYQLIWQRLMPSPLAPGQVGQLALCLRRQLAEDTVFEIEFTGGAFVQCVVPAATPTFLLSTVAFAEDLDRAYLYIERRNDVAPRPAHVYHNGREAQVRWLSADYVGGVAVAEVVFDAPLPRGGVSVFRVTDRANQVAAVGTLRNFSDLVSFGTYGGTNFERYAANGLTNYNSFTQLSVAQLDAAHRLGIRCVSMTHGAPNPEAAGHPGLLAYGQIDEPDVKDYGATDRPMRYRIGAFGPQMVEYEANCRRIDPVTATTLTINMTFTPYNYFVYAPIADLPAPDCYPVTHGFSIRNLLKYLPTIKWASAPGPFAYIYQGCWEEFAVRQDQWISGARLQREGFETYRDPDRVRGFGRPPTPAEVRIPMLYGIGFGARSLFSYTDASELIGTLMFHGSDVMPELWCEVGRTSRELTVVAPLINLGHPMAWARANHNDAWVNTLLAGERAALVVAVNNGYTSAPEAFTQSPLDNLRFEFAALPWLRPQFVYEVTESGVVPLVANADARTGALTWRDTLTDGKVYVVTGDTAMADELNARARAQACGQALAILSNQREEVRAAGGLAMRQRRLTSNPEKMTLVEAINGYNMADEQMWDPAHLTQNAIEFYQRSGDRTMGGQWPVRVEQEDAARPLEFSWMGRFFGNRVTLAALPQGEGDPEPVFVTELDDVRGVALRTQVLTFPEAGDYLVRITGTPPKPGEHGGRLARAAYLMPTQ